MWVSSKRSGLQRLGRWLGRRTGVRRAVGWRPAVRADGRSAVKQIKEVYLIGAFKDSIKVSGGPANVKKAPDEIIIEGYNPAGNGKEAEKDPK